MKRTCVIGGTGFIGSYVVWMLQATGRSVTVVGRNAVPTRPLPEGVLYRAGDYGDGYFLRGVLQGVEEVITLAYTTVPQSSFEDPVQDILGNLPASVKLFDTASGLGVEKLVFVSSGGTVYGKTGSLLIREDHPTNPISPYGITKLATEKYAMMFKELKDLPVVCVRPANAYGEGQKPFVGQGFVSTAIASVLRRQEVVLFGEKGTIRDYVHVTDVAKGIIAALDHGATGACYNIGTGVGRSNLDVLDAIRPHAEAAGLELKIKQLPLRRFDVPTNVLDSTKIREETKWEAVVTFKEGIERTWNWSCRVEHANVKGVQI